jgi:hypothetical protein
VSGINERAGARIDTLPDSGVGVNGIPRLLLLYK